MSTVVLKFGPSDHGRPLTFYDYQEADYDGGYRYELINGRLYVSPAPGPPHDIVETWLCRKLWKYVDECPEYLNHISTKAEVWVRKRKRPTLPLPDITGFRDYDAEEAENLPWSDLRPILVIEIMGKDSVIKDLDRNVKLYRRIPTVREYWVVDIRKGAFKPSLIAFRQRRIGWSEKTVGFRETYTTRLLPGFELIMDPRV